MPTSKQFHLFVYSYKWDGYLCLYLRQTFEGVTIFPPLYGNLRQHLLYVVRNFVLKIQNNA